MRTRDDEPPREDFDESFIEPEWLVKAIADHLGIEADAKRIDKAVYKGTDCGAWVRFDDEGIVVGTIVEGSEAEYSEGIDLRGITPDEAGAKLLLERFWAALQKCEDFSDQVWAEMEAEQCEE